MKSEKIFDWGFILVAFAVTILAFVVPYPVDAKVMASGMFVIALTGLIKNRHIATSIGIICFLVMTFVFIKTFSIAASIWQILISIGLICFLIWRRYQLKKQKEQSCD